MYMIGFLLGAGFSKALHNEMPIMAELLGMLENGERIPKYVPTSIRTDLERTLSYLWTNYPWLTELDGLRNRIDFLQLVRDLHKILSEREFGIWHELYRDNSNCLDQNDWKTKLAWILSQNDRSIVLTMNYDTLLERLMIASNQAGWLIYPAPIQRLYGIWSQQRDMTFATHDTLVQTGYGTGFGSFMPSLYKLHGCLSWYSLNGLDEDSIVYGLDMDQYYLLSQDPVPEQFSDTLFPVIVPPVADKTSMYSNKVLRSQWIGALNELRRCDELYCVGYSFPKSDLAMQLFMAEACGNVKMVHLVNIVRDSGMEERVRDFVDESTMIDWIEGTDCVEQMTKRLVDIGLFHGQNWATSREIMGK